MNDPRAIVQAYFDAWTGNDPDAAYALLAEDLHFAGPNASYESAAAFQPALVGFAAITRGARVVELVAAGDRVALLYDCDLPEPVGTLRIASFFRVEAGKIHWYETFFDPTTFRQLQARRG